MWNQFIFIIKPVRDPQRRLNPKMKEVVRKEILKLLEAGIIYPVADSQWVSPVHCVPKMGKWSPIDTDVSQPASAINH